MAHSSSLLPAPHRTLKPATPCRTTSFPRRKIILSPFSVASDGNSRLSFRARSSNGSFLEQSLSSSPATNPLPRNLGLIPSAELGLSSLLFVMSMVLGSFITLAIISFPAMNAFRRLEASVDKLSRVVSEEVPGTLSSLKLSGLEINDLTRQLSNLRQSLSRNVTKGKRNKRRVAGVRDNPIIS